MAITEKPTALQSDLDKAQNSFESFLTPEEAAIENEQDDTTEEVVETVEDEVEDELELVEDEVEEAEEEPQEDQVEDEETEQPQLYTIKVDGVEQEVTLEELQNGYSRQRDYTRKTQELSQQRKLIEQQQQELAKKDDVYNQLLPRMEAVLQGELANEPDWNSLYEADPIAYTRERDVWNEKKEKLKAVQAEQQRIQQENYAKQQQELQQFIKYGQEQLLQIIPEWQDNEVAAKEKAAIRQYGIDVLGYTAEQMDQVYDYRMLLGLRNAWMYNKTLKATKKKPTEKKAIARTGRPGTANVPKTATPIKKARQKLAQSGKTQDAAKVFEQII